MFYRFVDALLLVSLVGLVGLTALVTVATLARVAGKGARRGWDSGAIRRPRPAWAQPTAVHRTVVPRRREADRQELDAQRMAAGGW